MNQPNQSIWDYVKSLLHQHDCVIVPGFGGFVCNREPAKIDQVSHVITPPSRKVVFNQNLKTNDGLLAGYLAQKEQISYTQAIQLVEQTVATTLAILQEKKMYAIDLFGNFRLNADANYVFLPDKRNNYLVSSYGLGLIQAQPVTSRTIKAPKARIFKEKRNSPHAMTKADRNVWPKVLAGVLVVLLSVNGYIFLNDHSLNDLRIGNNNTMSITSWFDSLFAKTTEPVAKIDEPATAPIVTETIPVAPQEIPLLETEVLTDTTTATDDTENIDTYASLHAFATHYQAARSNVYFPQPIAVIDSVILPESTTEIEPTPIVSSQLSTEGIAKGFYVIGGVFCKNRNAKRFLEQLTADGYTDAEILLNTNINCKRVSYKKFTSHQEAEQFCLQLKASSNTSAWVLSAY